MYNMIARNYIHFVYERAEVDVLQRWWGGVTITPHFLPPPHHPLRKPPIPAPGAAAFLLSSLSSSDGNSTWLRAMSKKRGLQGSGLKSGGKGTRLGFEASTSEAWRYCPNLSLTGVELSVGAVTVSFAMLSATSEESVNSDVEIKFMSWRYSKEAQRQPHEFKIIHYIVKKNLPSTGKLSTFFFSLSLFFQNKPKVINNA